MDCADAIRSDITFERSNSRIESFRLAHVVASSEGVRRVKTDTKIEFRAGFYYLAKMLEAMAYALALPRSVFKQDAERAEFNFITSYFQALGAGSDSVRFARAFRAARMNN